MKIALAALVAIAAGSRPYAVLSWSYPAVHLNNENWNVHTVSPIMQLQAMRASHADLVLQHAPGFNQEDPSVYTLRFLENNVPLDRDASSYLVIRSGRLCLHNVDPIDIQIDIMIINDESALTAHLTHFGMRRLHYGSCSCWRREEDANDYKNIINVRCRVKESEEDPTVYGAEWRLPDGSSIKRRSSSTKKGKSVNPIQPLLATTPINKMSKTDMMPCDVFEPEKSTKKQGKQSFMVPHLEKHKPVPFWDEPMDDEIVSSEPMSVRPAEETFGIGHVDNLLTKPKDTDLLDKYLAEAKSLNAKIAALIGDKAKLPETDLVNQLEDDKNTTITSTSTPNTKGSEALDALNSIAAAAGADGSISSSREISSLSEQSSQPEEEESSEKSGSEINSLDGSHIEAGNMLSEGTDISSTILSDVVHFLDPWKFLTTEVMEKHYGPRRINVLHFASPKSHLAQVFSDVKDGEPALRVQSMVVPRILNKGKNMFISIDEACRKATSLNKRKTDTVLYRFKRENHKSTEYNYMYDNCECWSDIDGTIFLDCHDRGPSRAISRG